MPGPQHGKTWEFNIWDILAKGADSYTGTIDSTDGMAAIIVAPGVGNRIEVSAFSVQNATGSPAACSVSLNSFAGTDLDDKWVLNLGTTVAERHSQSFFPSLKLDENEGLGLKLSVANTGVRYNVQADVYSV